MPLNLRRKTLFFAFIWLICAGGIEKVLAEPDNIQQHKDIYLRKETGQIVFGNSKLKLEFDNTSGQWQSLFADGIGENLISPSDFHTIDFKIDGQAITKQNGADFLHCKSTINEKLEAVSLNLTFGVPASKKITESNKPAASFNYDFELTCTYTLFAGQGRLDRSAKLLRVSDANSPAKDALRLGGFIFQLPGVTIGESSDCVVDIPGPFWPHNYVPPESPYEQLTKTTKNFHSAPDAGFGLLTITNKRRNITLASWIDTGGEVNYTSSLTGDGKRISFRHDNLRAYRLKKEMTVISDVHRIEIVTGGLPAALAKYRQMCQQRMPLDPNTPSWVREMILLEVYPNYFASGFKEITPKLPFYRNIGFNTIYLMPHWVGGYSPIDPFKVDGRFGTTEDLKQMVQTAHSLGMRVLFDMVIHGFNEKSPLTKERPQLFVHNEQGGLARHPTWKSITTDWASEAYQQYMVDLILHDLKTYDIDGYRVDAASYKGPNWDPNIAYPAYLSGTAAPQLLKRMLKAMRQIKPDCVFLSEVFGPVFYNVCNLVHDNQTEAPQSLLEQMEAGQLNADHYKKHIANVLDVLPPGANRVLFARNHDTSWFYHFNGYSRRFMAMDAIHAFCVIPEVFAGDPRHGPNPDDDRATYDYYRKIFAMRKDYPEMVDGELILRKVESDNPWVFSALRKLNSQEVLILVSLSDKEENITLQISHLESRSLTVIRQMPIFQLKDPISSETIEVRAEPSETGKAQTIKLKLNPFQVAVGRL